MESLKLNSFTPHSKDCFSFTGTQKKSYIGYKYIILMMSKLGGIQCTSYKEDKPELWCVQCLRKPRERECERRMGKVTGVEEREGRLWAMLLNRHNVAYQQMCILINWHAA